MRHDVLYQNLSDELGELVNNQALICINCSVQNFSEDLKKEDIFLFRELDRDNEGYCHGLRSWIAMEPRQRD